MTTISPAVAALRAIAARTAPYADPLPEVRHAHVRRRRVVPRTPSLRLALCTINTRDVTTTVTDVLPARSTLTLPPVLRRIPLLPLPTGLFQG